MLRKLEQSADNIIGFSASGDVSDADYNQAASHLRDAIAQNDKIRVLLRVEDLSPKSFITGLDERMKFTSEHADDIERLAIVSNSVAADIFSMASGLLSDIDVESFNLDEEEKAWAWVK